MTQPVIPGEEKAWELLLGRDPDEICRNALVAYDLNEGVYSLKSLGMEFRIDPRARSIASEAPAGITLLTRLAYFFKLSIPWYLISAKDIGLTGRLVSPLNLTGGQLFFQGSHVLPLGTAASKYGADPKGFLKKGADLGGLPAPYGDAAFTCYPLPRVPVTFILWVADEEFPARVDLLFDSSCELQLPLDIIWSVAMMSLLILL